MGNSGHSATPTLSVSPSEKSKWKGMDLDAGVSLSVSFGCHYVQFNLPIAGSLAPVVKHPCHSSAFDVLLASVAMHNKLSIKPKLFLPPQKISTQLTIIFRQLHGNTKYLDLA